MSELNLLPCPFCGGTDVRAPLDADFYTCYGCMTCGPGPEGDETPTDAWNRRAEPTRCEWIRNEDGCYATSCGGNAFEFTDGTAADNKFQFCPYCGGTITERTEPTRAGGGDGWPARLRQESMAKPLH
jgi:Lar family restriction alleviation protein